MTDKRQYLAAMGIPLWLPRQPLAIHPDFAAGVHSALTEPEPERREPEVRAEVRPPLPAAERSATKAEAVDEPDPGLPPDDGMAPADGAWEPLFEMDAADDSSALSAAASREARIARMDWDELTTEARQCQSCGLCATRTQVVFGVGDHRAGWLIVGEAPGADEDRQGEPFVGRAGKLLDPMLQAIGLQREQVYIANILKCRPPDNREPTPAEVANCRPFLQRQIALIRPRIILAVGRIAAQNLLETDTQIGKLRGRIHAFAPARIPLVVTYHPAYLLRSPREKRKAWDDLRLARRVLATEPSGPSEDSTRRA
ncbi:MAG: uracil-DNA glycosylase [Candidatus Competibacteraceae bacterium]